MKAMIVWDDSKRFLKVDSSLKKRDTSCQDYVLRVPGTLKEYNHIKVSAPGIHIQEESLFFEW